MEKIIDCPVKIFGRPENLGFKTGNCDFCDGELKQKDRIVHKANKSLGIDVYGKDGCSINVYSEKNYSSSTP